MKRRWLLVGTALAVSLAFALTGARSARALNFTHPDFHLNFAAPGTSILIRQEIVGPGIVGPGIVAPDRVETVGIIICTSHTLRVTFSTPPPRGRRQRRERRWRRSSASCRASRRRRSRRSSGRRCR